LSKKDKEQKIKKVSTKQSKDKGMLLNYDNFNAMKVTLASPDQIRTWSYGEVKKAETINYRTFKPERDGLFCEKIFGPVRDWECSCGKYKWVKHKGVICDRCGVEVTESKVRRDHMGHIELAVPVAHIWFSRRLPSRMGLLLNMRVGELEQVVYYVSYVVIDPGNTPLRKKQLLSEEDYQKYRKEYKGAFKAGIGASAVKELLKDVNMAKTAVELRERIKGEQTGPNKIKLMKQLRIIDSFMHSGNKSEWMVMDVIPVIPPDLRPLVP